MKGCERPVEDSVGRRSGSWTQLVHSNPWKTQYPTSCIDNGDEGDEGDAMGLILTWFTLISETSEWWIMSVHSLCNRVTFARIETPFQGMFHQNEERPAFSSFSSCPSLLKPRFADQTCQQLNYKKTNGSPYTKNRQWWGRLKSSKSLWFVESFLYLNIPKPGFYICFYHGSMFIYPKIYHSPR